MSAEPDREPAARGPLSPWAFFPAIMLLSAVGIAYQVALMRVFSIGQWHHFAYMIISIAMLGFGASGAALALFRDRVRGWEGPLLRFSALGVAAAVPGSYVLSQQVPFETLQLLTERTQVWNLFLLYVILAAPFFLVATCITLGFFLAPRHIGRVYFFNMGGSGLGAAAAAGAMYALPPAHMPYWLAAAAVGAYLLLCGGGTRRRFALRAVPAAAVLLAVAVPEPLPVRVSEYKDLSYALQLPDAEIVAEAYSPLSQVTAVSSEQIRETPGQIANYPMAELGRLPRQIGLFFDAGAVSPVHRFDGEDLAPFAFLDYVTTALPYRLLDEPRALVLGAGGGTDVLSALYHGAEHVTAVEVDPSVFQLMEHELRDFSGGLFQRPDVDAVLAEGRGYLEARPDAEFDFIQAPLFGSFSAAASGVRALDESYVYTVEALTLYLDRLAEDGVLALTCWLKTPPRDGVKLFATAVEALEAHGVEAPEDHLAMIRSWNNATIVATRAPLTETQIAAIRALAEDRFLDLSYYPGVTADDVNRYTILDEPHYYNAAQAILFGDRQAFYENALFYVRPATDDRPHFFRFLKLETMPELVRQMGGQWLHYMEWGYLVLLATIGQAALASVLVILLPLIVLARRPEVRGAKKWTLLYFACLGAAFMFLEIGFIQIFMRFLAYPIYAVTVVLTAVLIFSGLGSLCAGMWRGRKPHLVAIAAAAICLLTVAYLRLLPGLFAAGAGWPDPVKIAVSIAFLAPLAFFMGLPFPSALQLVSDRAENLVPWAWGINGCFSTTGATLATFTAIHIGFTQLLGLAAIIYITAAFALYALEARLGGARP